MSLLIVHKNEYLFCVLSRFFIKEEGKQLLKMHFFDRMFGRKKQGGRKNVKRKNQRWSRTSV